MNQEKKLTLLAEIVFPIDPVPASRPRVSKWGTYYEKRYTNWMKEASIFLTTLPDTKIPDCELYVECEFVIEKKRTSKLRNPIPDIDNLVKAPLDSITKSGKFWSDDKFILELYASKRFTVDQERGTTTIKIYRIE